MNKTYCDICKREIKDKRDLNIIKINDLEGKPVFQPIESCSWCFVEIKNCITIMKERIRK